MKKWVRLWGVVLAMGVATLCMSAQEAAKKDAPKPASSPWQGVLEQWNDVGRGLTTMAEDFPEDKYELKRKREQRRFRAQLLHMADSTYFLTSPAMGKPMPAEE